MVAAVLVLLGGIASSGCDSLIVVTVPSTTSNGINGTRPSLEALANLTCLLQTQPAANLIVIVSSPGVTLFVDAVSLQSSLGRPLVSFSRPTLDAEFGNTLVQAGTSRRFKLTSPLACVPAGWRSMQLDVRVVTMSGTAQVLTTTIAE
jgi:hypothetical protein